MVLKACEGVLVIPSPHLPTQAFVFVLSALLFPPAKLAWKVTKRPFCKLVLEVDFVLEQR